MADAGAPHTSLGGDVLDAIARRLAPVHAELARRYPGGRGDRQPVQTYYAGAHLVTPGFARRLGDAALAALDQYAPDGAALASAVGLPGREPLADAVQARIREKLSREPLEDLRIDFEDGYGFRPDAEEDARAVELARVLAAEVRDGTRPPFFGIRVKPLTADLQMRGLRTLDLFVTTLVREAGTLPERFQLTLPKVSVPEQAAAFADALDALERRTGIAPGALRFDAMVETQPIVIGAAGRIGIPSLIDAARGRLLGVSIGIYDYTASIGITAAHQRPRHPACEFARHVMQVAVSGTGLWLSDGSTTMMPVPVHEGDSLTEDQRVQNRAAVFRGWRAHYEDVRHSLANAFYQGWDLHPAQLVSRYAAVYAFYLESADAAATRLKNFLARTASAALSGGLLEEIATGQALLEFFLRAISAGALTEEEVSARTGLTADELRGRSFAGILRSRVGRGPA